MERLSTDGLMRQTIKEVLHDVVSILISISEIGIVEHLYYAQFKIIYRHNILTTAKTQESK